MPYVMVFSQGEVFRNGVDGRVRPKLLTILGYLFYSLFNCVFLAPIYWFFLFKQLQRNRAEKTTRPESHGQPLP